MNDKEIRALIIKKQKELEALEKELEKQKYEKTIIAFSDAITAHPRLIELIKTNNLTLDDARYFGTLLGGNIERIYGSVAEAINKHKQTRLKKNAARKSRKTNSKKLPAAANEPEQNKIKKDTSITITADTQHRY